MFKVLVFAITLLSFLEASAIATKNIYYNQQINLNNIKFVKTTKITKCKPITKNTLKHKKYLALHYIKKNTPICYKDIKTMDNSKVIYKFNNFIEVEEYGKVITETNNYIKIKKPNGKIKKLTKDRNLH